MNEIISIDDIVRLLKSGCDDWSEFGNVNVKKLGDLTLFNYSAKAAYEKRWNYFECVSRGLIINHETGEIVARPFDKFFNWGEGERMTDASIVTISEKMDGSLGILYRRNGLCYIATRGSFDGDQACWATNYLGRHYELVLLPGNLTLLFEIIYPSNRIVIDYGQREDLSLLAARDRHTGKYLSLPELKRLAMLHGFSMPKIYTFDDVDELIENTAALDADAEGYVVEFSDGQRFKFKGLRYVELHRIISRLTFKSVLNEMENGTIAEFLEFVPDEFLGDTHEWMYSIKETIYKVKVECKSAFENAPKDTRKDFALWAMANHKHLSAYLFAMLDGREIEPLIYKKHDWDRVGGCAGG